MSYKPDAAWQDEARDFIKEWVGLPSLDDVRTVCHNLAAHPDTKADMESVCGSVSVYAETLWHWVRRVSGVEIY